MAENLLPKIYDFANIEEEIYASWEKAGYFKPTNDPKNTAFDPDIKPFVISIPPPNVTGILHQGHAFFLSLEDLMIRYHRMKGEPTLWVPGTDHAGIATQLQVEKLLEKEGLSREQVGREAFLERAWQWKEEHGGIIQQQIRRIGSSCDWERERFTLDEGLSRAVREAFVHLYEKGMIYRGPRLINWSPGLKTAVSDLEVEYSQEPGKMYYFKYMLADSDGEYIPVATTRPETILADTAVAVHPEDDRYQKYVGRQVIVPILGRTVPVIADEYVDREFGTGALKITPGHDPNDYAIGIKNNLPILSILDEKAHINAQGGKYAGLDRFECRKVFWADMQAAGLTIKEEPYQLNVPRSQRGGEIIEPMISTQWFVSIKPMAQRAMEAVQKGQVKIVPDHFTKVFYNWMENIEDWCISRQLWWGHRIPAWYCQDCGKMIIEREDPTSCPACGSTRLDQDPDVLDTWFSSALWPFSTLGWPEKTPDYQYFYPTSILETGYDILFFWVARMIMMGLELTDQAPFHTVYLHGLIRDSNGQKMSKSKNNVIDPLEVMNEYGTDALRFTLLVGSTPGKDMNLSVRMVEANRNFANKVWNAGRLVISSLDRIPDQPEAAPEWTLADQWISARLQMLVNDVERLFSSHQYGEAGRQIYEFFWSEFADWYLEVAKLQLNEGGDRAYYTGCRLVQVLDNCMRLLHPFTPYITEALWGHLKNTALKYGEDMAPEMGWEDALIIARWPVEKTVDESSQKKINAFGIIQDVIRSIRNMRAEKQVTPGKKLPAIIAAGEWLSEITANRTVIASLAHLDASQLELVEHLDQKPENSVGLVASGVEVYLPLSGMVDLEAEKVRIQNELVEVQKQIERLETLLDSPFAQKAPAKVVDVEREKLRTFFLTAEKLRSQLDQIK